MPFEKQLLTIRQCVHCVHCSFCACHPLRTRAMPSFSVLADSEAQVTDSEAAKPLATSSTSMSIWIPSEDDSSGKLLYSGTM